MASMGETTSSAATTLIGETELIEGGGAVGIPIVNDIASAALMSSGGTWKDNGKLLIETVKRLEQEVVSLTQARRRDQQKFEEWMPAEAEKQAAAWAVSKQK
jgi:hypothetical protein